jgi:hypothetical protein
LAEIIEYVEEIVGSEEPWLCVALAVTIEVNATTVGRVAP